MEAGVTLLRPVILAAAAAVIRLGAVVCGGPAALAVPLDVPLPVGGPAPAWLDLLASLDYKWRT